MSVKRANTNMMADVMKPHEAAMGDPICNEGGYLKRTDEEYCNREIREPGSCRYGQRCDVSNFCIRIRCSDENFVSFIVNAIE